MQAASYKARGLNAGQIGKPRHADRQSPQLLMALALLLVLLTVVVARNRDFWFGTDEVADSDSPISQSVAAAKPAIVPTKSAEPAVAAPVVKIEHHTKATVKPAEVKSEATPVEQPAASSAPVVATNRVALPPLDVEVVAGDKHSTIHPGSNVTVAQITDNPSHATDAAAVGLAVNAAQREHLSTAAAPEQRSAVETSYPALGLHSNVQGSVVLEAVVAADGSVEGLRVLSGPSILSAAAQQAVRQWRFKPYMQNGQPVETKARITVNFSIHVSGNQASAS
jgi:TonB family protein